jgi:hypothetical protein
LLFVLAHDGGLAGNMMSESYYSHRFGLAFFWFFVVFGMRFLQGRKRRDVWLSALFAFSACATHVFFSLLISLAGVTILLWKVCFPGRSFRDHAVGVLLLAAAVAVAALPYMLFRYLTAFPAGGNELHDQVQGVVLLGGPFYVAQPLRLIRWFGPVGIVSFAAVIPLWALMKKNYGLGFLVASLLMIPIVLFNPILLPPLHELMTYLVFRMNNLCPFFALAAFFLYTFFHDREFRRHRKVWSMLIAAAMLGAVVIAALPIGRDGSLSRERQIREQEYSYLLWKEPLDRLDATLPARSVIASDPLTSYSITAFTPYHVVCTLDQHAPPNDALLEDRVRSARAILSPYVSMKQTTELLARHGATHVILNNHQPERFLIEYWLMDRDIYPESYEKFSAHPELFTPAALADEFVVFEWNGQQSDDDRPPSNAFKPLALPDNAVRVGRRAGDAILEGIHVGPDHVERGGTVAVEVIWSGTGDYRLRNYNVSIRFDHRRPDVPFGGAPFPKIMRKLKEQLIGARYRFREQHKIRNGFLSPDTWAPGELIIDATNVAVPTDLVPGRYAISVKLFEEIHQPNLRVRDFLYDDDMYQGIQVSEIVIE